MTDDLDRTVELFRREYRMVHYNSIRRSFKKYSDIVTEMVVKQTFRGRLGSRLAPSRREKDYSINLIRYADMSDIFRFIDRDDIRQMIDLFLIRAIRRYRSNYGFTFRHFAYLYIARLLGKWIQYQFRKCSPSCEAIRSVTGNRAAYEMAIPDSRSFNIKSLPEYMRFLSTSKDVVLRDRKNIMDVLGYSRDQYDRLCRVSTGKQNQS